MFVIEEDAYKLLEAYLSSIRAHYAGDEAAEDILADIEASVAEKFSEKIGKQQKAVTLTIVEEVIAVMGRVEEIAAADDEDAVKSSKKKEERSEEQGAPRRLYRDPDDVVIAGVASGIAAYFNIDPLLIRILFIALAFANGLGVLLYLVLWLAVPKAETGAQRLEMRGRRVNLEKIKEAVKERSAAAAAEGKEAVERFRKSSTFYRILNFPIRVLEVIFRAVKRIFSALGPVTSIVLGIFITIPTAFMVAGLTALAAVLLFSIGSPDIVSDLPLNELAGRPLYYVGVIALYFVVVIPLLFIMALGGTLLARKNQFRAISSAVFIAIWMISIAAVSVAAAELVPWAQRRAGEMERAVTVTRTYEYADFEKLYIGGDQEVTVTPGDEFSITYSGRAEDLDGLEFAIEEGQLQITHREKEREGLCIFCSRHPVTAVITMPELVSYVGIGTSSAEIAGFKGDLYVSLGELARADIALAGQNIEGKLSGIASRLSLKGEAQNVMFEMDGSSRLDAEDVAWEALELEENVFSRASLRGTVQSLTAEVNETASLDARELRASSVIIRTHDMASASVWPEDMLEATAFGSSHIDVRGTAASSTVEELDLGTVNMDGEMER